MNEFSVLIGGKAGDGINQSGLVLAELFNRLGYRSYIYFDYPSLIRGGHNFSIIRTSKNKIATHRDKIDFLIALNQDTVNLHKDRLKNPAHIIYDSDSVQASGTGFPLKSILKEESALPIMRNSVLIGAFAKSIGIKWKILEDIFKSRVFKDLELNLKLALRGYGQTRESLKIEPIQQKPLPVLTGNEAIGLGLIKAGLKTYIAYPMTPSSSILHFLAQVSDEFNLKVIHPENEIAVMLMALGFSFSGQKSAVGTSGGGFCLMAEGLSLASMAELPIVIVISQRPGPSTGIPTYTAQTDLHFALNAGQGEFVRFIVAPGDVEEAFYWSCVALNISWKYQIPSIILSDKTLSEGVYSFEIDSIADIKEEKPVLWNRTQPYKRYLDINTGVSPLTFVPDKDAITKVNSYEHDESGITTEDAKTVTTMYQKRLRKEKNLIKELETYEAVKSYGNKDSSIALLCWGSNKGVCKEIGESLGLKVIQPIVLSPYPLKQFKNLLKGVKKLIVVENNATAQLARLIKSYGFNVDEKILKYNGRPFSLDDLEKEIKKVGL